LLGVMAQVVSRSYILPIIAILVALLIARAASVYGTRWSIRGSTPADNELLFLMLPRGLITAVLALQIVSARGAAFNFLPAMAFTVVLVTNMFVVIASFRLKPVMEAGTVTSTPGPVMADAAAAASAGPSSGATSVAEAAQG
jgi:hypothetical protein